MIAFDKVLQYQFGYFFGPGRSKLSPKQLQDLPGIVGRQSDDQALVIPLRERKEEESIALLGDRAVQVSTVTWGTGVWRLIFSPLRLDLHVDARAYADVARQELNLAVVQRRISENLAAAMEYLGTPARRFVTAVNAETTEIGDRAVAIVAKRCFRPGTVTDALDVPDLLARVNVRTRWPIGPAKQGGGLDVLVNRIEQTAATWNFEGGVNRTLACQWDVNTSPELGDEAALQPKQLSQFFERAVAWIQERILAVSEER